MRMFNPPHPGEILAEFWLEPLKLTITQAAKNLNVTRKRCLLWLMEKRPLAQKWPCD